MVNLIIHDSLLHIKLRLLTILVGYLLLFFIMIIDWYSLFYSFSHSFCDKEFGDDWLNCNVVFSNFTRKILRLTKSQLWV